MQCYASAACLEGLAGFYGCQLYWLSHPQLLGWMGGGGGDTTGRGVAAVRQVLILVRSGQAVTGNELPLSIHSNVPVDLEFECS